MKKVLALSILLNVMLVVVSLALYSERLAVAGVGTPRIASENGDTNGDGGIDVSDAVYLLNNLFRGGPELAVIDCGSIQPRSCLVATGQVDCFGTASEIDCSIPRARGQDAYYRHGCPLEGRFVENDDGTISDTCTGLMWTKHNVDVNNDGEIVVTDQSRPSADMLPWHEACQFAEDMSYLGYDDWRVPNVNELLSIIDFSYSNNVNGGQRPPFLMFPPFAFQTTWTSTHLRTRALGVHLQSLGFPCDCCVVNYVDHAMANIFVAVRGPDSR